MAITAATLTSDFSGFLPAEIAQEYFTEATKMSVVQSLARQVQLGANGASVPVLTSKPTAAWVAEGQAKPATQAEYTLKTMTPQKIAAIAVVSAEVVRANPGGYVTSIRPQLAEAFAVAFDSAALHGTSTPFSAYIDQTSKSVEIGGSTAAMGGVWADLNDALRLLANDRKRLTGFALDDVLEPTLNASVDSNGRPIFVDTPLDDTSPVGAGADPDSYVRRARLMGRTAYLSQGIATSDLDTVVGYAGDWRQVVWGVVGGITYDVSTQATVTINGTLTSLWENNLVAVRAEAEYGLLINDVASFVRLRNLIGS